METGKWIFVFALAILCIALSVTQASAGAPYTPILTYNNNLSIDSAGGVATGGANDILFSWDGTLRTSVAASGQVSNANINAKSNNGGFVQTCKTGTSNTAWKSHDAALYGPGTYTVYAGCAAGSPGCGTGTAINFTVGTGEVGVHMLVDWGTVASNKNIDVVNVWKLNSAFGPSSMWTGACGANAASTVWDLMSKDPGTGHNGYPMMDGPFVGTTWNFNMMGAPINRIVDTSHNNFTMLDLDGNFIGGTNDVRFTWDGTKKTATECPQISNATISSSCSFFGTGKTWAAHDVAIYGPGTYTIYDACPAGCPNDPLCDNGSGANNPVTFTVNPGETGGHMLFFWGGNDNIDVVDIWQPNRVFAPSPLMDNITNFIYGCGSNPASTVWDWMSYDWGSPDGAGGVQQVPNHINGAPMTDGPFGGSYANFNLMTSCAGCGCICLPPASYDDGNPCTIDSCDATAFDAIGLGVFCPGLHTPAPAGTVCRASAGPCDVAETCDGTIAACPADAFKPSTTICRASAGVCDVAEKCTGSSAACPADAFAPVGTSCNDSIGCNGTDTCNGSGTCNHSGNPCATPPYTTLCIEGTGGAYTCCGCVRNADCDDGLACTTDTCTACICSQSVTTGCLIGGKCIAEGAANPANPCQACLGTTSRTSYSNLPSGTACGGNATLCDALDTCNGAGTCIDNVAPAGTVCRPVAGVCDIAETCDGMSKICPVINTFAPFTNLCRPPAGVCDVAEYCTGTSAECPTDVFAPSTTICRPSASVCDVAESCTGTGPACPADAFAPNGTSCNDSNLCTTGDVCTNGVCVGTAKVCEPPMTCQTATGLCDLCGCVSNSNCNDNNSCTSNICDGCHCQYVANDSICPTTTGNNFTMLDPNNNPAGGANDVVFAWDGTMRTSVAPSGQVANAIISSSCSFFGIPWKAHDVTVYGPGHYCIDADCPAGSPGCGLGAQFCFTVGAGEIGIHMLFDWNGNNNIDVVNVMEPNAVAPNLFTGGPCGSNDACTIWRWVSKDIDADGVPGMQMIDGPFQGMEANFNLIKVGVDPCCKCSNGDSCTIVGCDPVIGCIYTKIDCDDHNACTTDSCNPATGCVHTEISCNDNNACTADSCNPATGCVHTPINCDDGNKCTVDTCDTTTGCHNTPIACDDGNKCTIDTCDTAKGCVFTPKVCPIPYPSEGQCYADVYLCDPATGLCKMPPLIDCDDHNACTIDTCNSATGCVHTLVNCDDHNVCTVDFCNPTTGCGHSPVNCDDGNACTSDGCDPATGCFHIPIVCNDGNACTIDACDPTKGCVYTPKICPSDNNPCTTDSCNSATGACVYIPVPNGTSCSGGIGGCGGGSCQSGTCTGLSICPSYAHKTVTLKGTGQNWWMEDQIMTSFSVVGCGCIFAHSDNSVTVSPNTVLSVNWRVGKGPQPTSVTWKPQGGSSQTLNAKNLWTLTCPSTTGTVGTLTLNNASAHGKDTDTLTVKTATH